MTDDERDALIKRAREKRKRHEEEKQRREEARRLDREIKAQDAKFVEEEKKFAEEMRRFDEEMRQFDVEIKQYEEEQKKREEELTPEEKIEANTRARSQEVRITGIYISKNEAHVLVDRLLSAFCSVVWEYVVSVALILFVLVVLVVALWWVAHFVFKVF